MEDKQVIPVTSLPNSSGESQGTPEAQGTGAETQEADRILRASLILDNLLWGWAQGVIEAADVLRIMKKLEPAY